jgi:hypothetical protein
MAPGTLTLSSLLPSAPPFAMPEAGFGYFATQAHYRSLASRIITALGGFNVVVVTGDRLSSGPTLSTALGEAAAGHYTVSGFPCESELGRYDVLHLRRALSASLASGEAAGGEFGVPALIVFDDTDRFSDEEIEEIFKHVDQRARVGDHRIAAAVFLVRPEFLTRLERPVLRFWLAKRLFVARLRFHELGADEIPAFIHHQLPSRDAESIFTDKAIAAIASVSGGDPAVVNRFSRRMLASVAANTSDRLVKANVGWGTMVPSDMPPEERGVTTFRERQLQNRTAREFGTQFSTRMWRDRGAVLKLCAGTVFCFACVGVVAAVVYFHPIEEGIAAFSNAPANDTSAKVPERGSLADWTALPEPRAAPAAISPSDEPTVVPAGPASTAMAAFAALKPEEASAIKMPALSPSLAVLSPTAEVAKPTEDQETIAGGTITPPVLPTGVAPIATAVSPSGTPAPKPTTSDPGPTPAQLRLPAADIAALLSRGDTLFALGDISSARLFYERAADAGDGHSALRLGNTFDPAFADFAHLRVRGDPAMAVSWYSRARELGEGKAEILLKRLEPVPSR